MREKKLISIENTRFIFRTNFSGDPDRDTFGSDARRANVIIPDPDMALAMREEGFNVKETKPRPDFEDEFIPEYYIAIGVNYDTNWPPKIYLVSGDAEPLLLNEESVSCLDMCRVRNVNVVLNPYENSRTGRKSLYVRTMYVEQDVDDDPFANRYRRRNVEEDDDGTLPF
jgi:hypothetical protein